MAGTLLSWVQYLVESWDFWELLSPSRFCNLSGAHLSAIYSIRQATWEGTMADLQAVSGRHEYTLQ